MFQEEEGKKEKKSSKLLLDIIDILVEGGRDVLSFFPSVPKSSITVLYFCARVCISSFFFNL